MTRGYPLVIEHGLLEHSPFIDDDSTSTVKVYFSLEGHFFMFDCQRIVSVNNYPKMEVFQVGELSWIGPE